MHELLQAASQDLLNFTTTAVYALHFRGSVQAEGNLVAVSHVDQGAHAIAGASGGVVLLHTLGVAPAALHIALQKMAVDRVEDDLRNLRAVGVIEQDEGGF
jgi:hypothetical protein